VFFDFVFSFITFQHIPAKWIVYSYISEIGRVLKPGGLFKFQVNGSYVPWYKRFKIQDSKKIPLIHKKVQLTLNHPNTLSGVCVSRKEIEKEIHKHRLEIISLTGEGSQYMWVEGKSVK